MEIVNRNKVESFVTKDSSEIREILAPRNSSLKAQSLAEARVAPGIAIPAGKKHKIWDIGVDELVFLCCCSPCYEDNDMVLSE